jgi:hypothetical protein
MRSLASIVSARRNTYDEQSKYMVPLPDVKEDVLERAEFAPGNDAEVGGRRNVCSWGCASLEEGCRIVKPHSAQLEPDPLRL